MCPICRKAVVARANNPSFPFCSTRCKSVDLGKWLNEEYRVPVETPPPGRVEGVAGHTEDTGA
jgi:endogenous inhibitor of DNA gyrase (YacG/DUF329 family)